MLSNVLLKTLYEKRWSLLGWIIAIVTMTVLTVALFPTFKEAFGQSLQDVPESMKAFFGDMNSYRTLAGYVDIQVIAQMVFITIIMGVILGSGLIAGDEGEGTLQSLLAQPIKRQKVFIQKYLAMLLLLLVACFAIFAGTYVAAFFINETMDWSKMLQATIGMWVITSVFSVIAFTLGAITGKRGISGSAAGMLAFVSYLITSLAVGVDVLKTVDKLSPFHYFNTPSILTYGIDWGNMLVLLGIIVGLTTFGFYRFIKRDIA